MDSKTRDAIPSQIARRALVMGGLTAALGALASGTAAGGRSGKRPRKKSKCSWPGEACKTHGDCCTKGGMCIETELEDSDGKKQSRRCAAA
jgi:hypothetical protein